MILNVYYESIDPDYSSHDQVFIGIDEESCYRQKYEYEKWQGRDHINGIRSVYRVTILENKYEKRRTNF